MTSATATSTERNRYNQLKVDNLFPIYTGTRIASIGEWSGDVRL